MDTRSHWSSSNQAMKAFLSDIVSRTSTAGFIRTHVADSDTPSATTDTEVDDPEFVRDMEL